MVRRAYQQRSLIEVLLPDADKLWDPTLRRIDALLDDEGLVDRVAEALGRRDPQSRHDVLFVARRLGYQAAKGSYPLYRGSQPSTATKQNRELTTRVVASLGFQPTGGAGSSFACRRRVAGARPGSRARAGGSLRRGGEEPKQAEQERDHRAEIVAGSEPTDQPLGHGLVFGEGQLCEVVPVDSTSRALRARAICSHGQSELHVRGSRKKVRHSGGRPERLPETIWS
jgi:hypothetical protein